MYDSHTIYLVGFVSQGIFALTLALLAVSDRRTRGTGWLAAGSWLQLLMTSSRAILHNERNAVAASAGSCLLVLAFFFLYMGLRWFTVRRALKTKTGPITVSASMLAVLVISAVSISYGRTAARIVAEVMMVMIIPMLWRTRIAALRETAKVAATLLTLLAITMFFRTTLDLVPRSPVVDTLDLTGRIITMFVATALSFSFVGFFVAEVQRRLHDETRIDVLTGLCNRRSMEEVAARRVKRSEQQGSPLSLVVLDVDFFKNLNDTWGHAVGDRALEILGSTLQTAAGHEATTARLGGEEFAVLLPGIRMEEAAQVAENLRRRIEEIRIEESGHFIGITVSAGVSSLRAGERGWLDMLRRADKALYRAKHEGRNRVSVWCERDGVRGSRSDAKLRHWRNPWSSSSAQKAEALSLGADQARAEAVN